MQNLSWLALTAHHAKHPPLFVWLQVPTMSTTNNSSVNLLLASSDFSHQLTIILFTNFWLTVCSFAIHQAIKSWKLMWIYIVEKPKGVQPEICILWYQNRRKTVKTLTWLTTSCTMLRANSTNWLLQIIMRINSTRGSI